MNENSGTESRERERERELSELRKLVEEQKSQLKKLTSGGFMAAKLHNELAEIPADQQDNDEIRDGYQLKFVGKDYAKLQAGLKTETIITPDTAHNSKPENANSENIFITGDNLDALKHLENAYSGKVDMIYIDPPYNTGSDGFVYADNFKFSDDDFKEKLNLTEEEISRVRALNGKSSHSAWLTFMLPRLMISKRLLSDTGVIFISIDDNEQAQLKMICDEIFNERNKIACIVSKTPNQTSDINKKQIHEYILAYSKNIDSGKILEGDKILQYARCTTGKASQTQPEITILKGIEVIDLPDGKYTKVRKTGGNEDLHLIGDEITVINGVLDHDIVLKGRWSNPNDVRAYMKKLSLNSTEPIYNKFGKELVRFYLNGDRFQPIMEKIGSDDIETVLDITTKGSLRLQELGLTETFLYPKSPELLKHLLSKIPNKNSLILDFFAGSATTADAVMQLNKEDGGNRKYILVQLPEKVSKNSEAEKAGYKTIDQISRERIERAAAKIGDNSGFKHFRLTTLNDENALSKLEEFDPNAIVAFPEDMTTTFDGGEKAILQTWSIDDGFEFNQIPKIVEFAGYQAHYIEQRLYLISTGWGSEATRELLNAIGKNKLAVQSIVIFPYSFTFNELNELKINLRTAFEKSNKIELLERY